MTLFQFQLIIKVITVGPIIGTEITMLLLLITGLLPFYVKTSLVKSKVITAFRKHISSPTVLVSEVTEQSFIYTRTYMCIVYPIYLYMGLLGRISGCGPDSTTVTVSKCNGQGSLVAVQSTDGLLTVPVWC